MITVRNLTKCFGRIRAVDDISFEVGRGEIVGLLGPNGAGKTTTLRILACFLPPTTGTVQIDGLDIFRNSLEIRRRLGYLPENVPLYVDMRVGEYLRYRAKLKGLRGRRLRTRLMAVVDACELRDVINVTIGQLSRGYRQRVGLADALVHEPPLLILDEPSLGLDPNQIRHTRQLIRDFGQGHTVILSTHILHEVEMICDRVLILHKGRIVASGGPAELVGRLKGRPLTICELKAPAEVAQKKIAALQGVMGVSCSVSGEWTRLTCEGQENTDLREAVFKVAVENGWTLRELTMEKPNLEDVFVALTKRKEV